jgi:hypothetical protein
MLGCTPALNWREVPLGSTKVMLPCKPDRAQRPVQLGEKQMNMEMVGCEAGSALFAASRLEVPPAEQPAVLAQWHRASLASLGDITQSQAAPPLTGQSLAVIGQGKGQDGSAIQARFLWQTGGREVILLAVYAPHIGSDMTEPFLIDLKLQ